jgi:hypothetical protein
MDMPGVRGALLEEVVLYLLEKVGYRVVVAGEDGTHAGAAGLEIQGRGERHQIDALAAYDYTPAFMYPLRLLVEAKCYRGGYPVQIGVVRNSVGVHKDISENYFSYASAVEAGIEVKVQRFNFQSAIFSTSSYTRSAERYAIAHQVFLIQYERVKVFEPVTEGLLALGPQHMAPALLTAPPGSDATRHLRKHMRELLEGAEPPDVDVYTDEGLLHILTTIVAPLRLIGGSYFGMLQGKWPMHFLSAEPLPPALFARSDILECAVRGRGTAYWAFVPMGKKKDDPEWFELQFDLPPEVAELVRRTGGDAVQIAQVKQEYFSFVTLAGKIGGVRRQVMLRLNEEWIADYVQRKRDAN